MMLPATEREPLLYAHACLRLRAMLLLLLLILFRRYRRHAAAAEANMISFFARFFARCRLP